MFTLTLIYFIPTFYANSGETREIQFPETVTPKLALKLARRAANSKLYKAVGISTNKYENKRILWLK